MKKREKVLDPDCINTIKLKCLSNLYEQMPGHGRTWGTKDGGNNPLFGTHVTFIGTEEIVILVQERGKKPISMYQFKKTPSTELGEEIIQKLKDNGHYNQLRLR